MATEKAAVAIAQPNRQVLTIFLSPGGAGDEKGVDKKLNLAFNPKEMIVRQVTWSGLGSATTISSICSSIHKDQTIAIIGGGAEGAIAPATAFNLVSRPDSVRFWITENGTASATAWVGNIALVLEFRG